MSDEGPQTKLEIPQGLRARAFRAIETILREAPSLTVVDPRWRTRQGFDTDMQPPGSDGFPMIALSPQPLDDSILTGEHSTVNFSIAVEIWAEGSCVDDLLNIWDAVCEALRLSREFREGQTVQQYLRCGIPGIPSISIPNLTLRTPAFFRWIPSDTLRRKDNDPGRQWGLGTIAFYFQRPR